ncbi:hypothetical protein [Methylorubrum populi]|uniref:hypothetical protein n=1 Tax=Methylorubrum populi TaxID=223967 RepID=UPI0012FF7E46|nr:hypothetical protein [Methylorubrum populi]
MACFTGARISEICQLERSDIVSSKGNHYFRMTTEYDSEGEESQISEAKKAKKTLRTTARSGSFPYIRDRSKKAFWILLPLAKTMIYFLTRRRIALGIAAAMQRR